MFSFSGGFDSVKKEIKFFAPNVTDAELERKSILEIANDYYSIDKKSLQKLYLMDDNLTEFLNATTFKSIFSCYVSWGLLAIKLSNFSLDNIMSFIKAFEEDPSTVIHVKIFILLKKYNSSFVNSIFPPGFKQPVSKFCGPYIKLVNDLYDPFMIKERTDAFGTTPTIFKSLINYLNISTYYEDLIKSFAMINGYMKVTAEESIKEVFYKYIKNISLSKENNNHTVFEFLEKEMNFSGSVISAVFEYSNTWNKISSRILPEMKLHNLLDTLQFNISNTVKDVIVLTDEKTDFLTKLRSEPIMMMSRRGNKTHSQIANLTPSKLISFTNLSDEFVAISVTKDQKNNLKARELLNKTVLEIAHQYYNDKQFFPLNRFLHLQYRCLVDPEDIIYLNTGRQSLITARRESETKKGMMELINSVTITELKMLFELNIDEFQNKPVADFLRKKIGMYDKEFKIFFSTIPTHMFQISSFKNLLDTQNINGSMTLSGIREKLKTLKNKGNLTNFRPMSHVLILYSLKIPENRTIFCVFRGCKMGIVV